MKDHQNIATSSLRLSDEIYELQCIISFFVDATARIAAVPEEVDDTTVRGTELIGSQIKSRLYTLKTNAENFHVYLKKELDDVEK